jgi:hypothetical protein
MQFFLAVANSEISLICVEVIQFSNEFIFFSSIYLMFIAKPYFVYINLIIICSQITTYRHQSIENVIFFSYTVNYIEFQKCCSIIFTLEKKKIFTTLDEFDFFLE